MSENVLTIENATMQFGGVVAVDNLNLKVDKNQIVSLIGPNGAGKTTAFNVVTGVYAPTNGAVWFEGRKIIENTPHGKMKKLYKGQNAGQYSHIIAPTPDKITQMGIARTFQNIRLWKKPDRVRERAHRQALPPVGEPAQRHLPPERRRGKAPARGVRGAFEGAGP